MIEFTLISGLFNTNNSIETRYSSFCNKVTTDHTVPQHHVLRLNRYTSYMKITNVHILEHGHQKRFRSLLKNEDGGTLKTKGRGRPWFSPDLGVTNGCWDCWNMNYLLELYGDCSCGDRNTFKSNT